MSPMTDVEVVIAGAGIIGLAVARALAQSGRDVLVLESADSFGTGSSSRACTADNWLRITPFASAADLIF